MTSDDPADAFAALAARFLERADDSATTTRGFGASALKRHGRIFAMLQDRRLVVKLPAARVIVLIAEGAGGAFMGSRGAPMREWVAIPLARAKQWEALADEAWRFADSGKA